MYTSFGMIYQNTNGYHISRFLKGYSAYHCFRALSKVGTKLDQIYTRLDGASGALLNDLSKAFKCILLDLFNAKLHAHSLELHI